MTDLMKTDKPYQILSAGTLKIIAIVTMLIDHFAAGVYAALYEEGFLLRHGLDSHAVEIYNICRDIGRFAYPVFCFLLVEGFFYTKNRFKYMRNLVLFALISEVPFDLCLKEKIGLEGQNVFFTLAIALGVIWGVTKIKEKWEKEPVISVFLQGSILLAGCVLAYVLKTDYSYYGIVLVAIFYFYRNNRFLACLVGYVWFLFEPWCFPAFIALLCYNGKRGIRLKYFFYAFYPAHLLLLYGLRVLLIGK